MPGDAVADGAAKRPRLLAQRRKALGLTQEQLADLLDVDRTTVARWERGETQPLPWLRPKLAKALKVSTERIEALLAGPESAGPGGSASVLPRQLPAAVADFTGRAAELRTLTRMLEEAGPGMPGTVVISAIGGTAGVGKTALAVQWAHQVAERFPDGQLYVSLRGYDPDGPMPPADALAGFLRALGVGGQDIPPGEEERAARYRSLLAGRRVLVVLDNAGSVAQVAPLLPGSPSCAVVVTSRDALAGLVARHGATRLEVGLLPPADAIGLLCALIGERADANPDAAATLAERCCRLPLALRVAAELAIARPDVPLAGLAGELADQQKRLDLLDVGGDPRTAVRAVFSWSYRHLDDSTARAFRLVGLHPGDSFDPYAAAALTGTTLEEARRMLEALIRAHLIQLAGPDRHSSHDLLRAYARELTQTHDGEDQQRAALTRLFDHYLHAAATAMDTLYPAERHRRPVIPASGSPVPPLTDPAAAQGWLDAERRTLVAVTVHAAGYGWPRHATTLAATLFRYLESGSYYAEGLIIHTHARLAAQLARDPAGEAAALNALGAIDFSQARPQQGTDKLGHAVALFRQAGDRTGEARALINLSSLYTYQGQYQQAIRFGKQALRASRHTGDRISECGALVNLGRAERLLGRFEQAAHHLKQSLGLARETGNRRGECFALIELGGLELAQDSPTRAAGHLFPALALARESGSRRHQGGALTLIGDLCLRQGRIQEANGRLHEALALYRESGDRASEAITLNSLGEVCLADGRPGEARRQHTAALALAIETGQWDEQARARHGLGNACHAAGDEEEGRRYWQEALALYTNLGAPKAGQVRTQLSGTDHATDPEPACGCGKPAPPR